MSSSISSSNSSSSSSHCYHRHHHRSGSDVATAATTIVAQQPWCSDVRHCRRFCLEHGHGTVCHKRLGPVSHLQLFGGRPSLTFSVSHMADLHCPFGPSADVCVELCNDFGFKLCKSAPQLLRCNMNICSSGSGSK